MPRAVIYCRKLENLPDPIAADNSGALCPEGYAPVPDSTNSLLPVRTNGIL